MDTWIQTLQGMLIYVINLVRQPDRKKNIVQLLNDCGFNRTAIFPAVDGDALSASGGRLRKLKQQWRLAYGRKENGAHVRVVAHLRMTALASAGGANPWRQYGCLKSHESVLAMARTELSHHPLCLICEDDLMLGKAAAIDSTTTQDHPGIPIKWPGEPALRDAGSGTVSARK